MAGPGRRLADVIFYGAVLAVLGLLVLVARRDVGLAEGLQELCAGLLLVGTVATVAWVAWRLWSRPRTPTARELARRFEEVRFMGGTQFEVFVADLFRAMGHQVMMSGGVGDQGVDIIVEPGSRRIAVQCKNHLRPVGSIRRWIGKVDALEKERANETPQESVNGVTRSPHHDDPQKG
jgi:hypothetical protein